jgi:hypothetical protein
MVKLTNHSIPVCHAVMDMHPEDEVKAPKAILCNTCVLETACEYEDYGKAVECDAYEKRKREKHIIKQESVKQLVIPDLYISFLTRAINHYLNWAKFKGSSKSPQQNNPIYQGYQSEGKEVQTIIEQYKKSKTEDP